MGGRRTGGEERDIMGQVEKSKRKEREG